MKTTITVFLSLLLGIIIGTIYGWRTGYVDGVVQSRLEVAFWLPRARVLSSDQRLNKKFDILAASTAGIFANSHSFSPLMFVFNTKAETGLSDILVYKRLFAPDLPLDRFTTAAAFGASGAYPPPPLAKIQSKIAAAKAKLDEYFDQNPEKLEQIKKRVEQGAAANP